MDEKVSEKLRENANISINQQEKERIVKKWKKMIYSKVIGMLAYAPLLIVIILITLKRNPDDNVDKVIGITIMFIFSGLMLMGMIETLYNIRGLLANIDSRWERSLVFIKTKKGGKILGSYFYNRRIIDGVIKHNYGDFFRFFHPQTYGIIIYFLDSNKKMLITEYSFLNSCRYEELREEATKTDAN